MENFRVREWRISNATDGERKPVKNIKKIYLGFRYVTLIVLQRKVDRLEAERPLRRFCSYSTIVAQTDEKHFF